MAKTMQIRSDDGSMEVYYTEGVPAGGTGPVMARLGPSADGEGDARLEVFYKNGQPMARLGGLPGADRVGLEILDETGAVKALAGELTDGDYGLAVVNPAGQLVKLGDFVFGPRQSTVDTFGGTSSTGFGNLASSFGPEVGNVKVGETGRVMVIVSARIGWSGTGGEHGGAMSIQLAGANSVAAGVDDSPGINRYEYSNVAFHNSFQMVTRVRFLEGLNPGYTHFTAKYCSFVSGVSVDFQNRVLAVLPY